MLGAHLDIWPLFCLLSDQVIDQRHCGVKTMSCTQQLCNGENLSLTQITTYKEVT